MTIHCCEFDVRFHETDLMGVVHHANYFHYFEMGRVGWLQAQGMRYEDWIAQGIHLPVVSVALRYRQAARFGDRLSLETCVTHVTGASIRFAYRLYRQAEPTILLCEGETVLACVGETLAPKRFPAHLAGVLRKGMVASLS